MVNVADIVGLVIIVGVNGAAAALMTRFFRVRLQTVWGPIVFAILLEWVVLLLLVLLLSGVLGLGPNLQRPPVVFGTTVLLPLSLGVAFDYLWMPAPAEVDLPTEPEGSS